MNGDLAGIEGEGDPLSVVKPGNPWHEDLEDRIRLLMNQFGLRVWIVDPSLMRMHRSGDRITMGEHAPQEREGLRRMQVGPGDIPEGVAGPTDCVAVRSDVDIDGAGMTVTQIEAASQEERHLQCDRAARIRGSRIDPGRHAMTADNDAVDSGTGL